MSDRATVPGISLLRSLRKDSEIVLSRGFRNDDSASVLVLTPASDLPTPACLKRLEHEFSLRENLDPAWAARPLEITRYEGRLALLFADPGGEVLEPPRGFNEERFLRVAIGLAGAIGKMHAAGLIHKDLKPSNVLFDEAASEVRLTGFGIASRLPRERQPLEPPEIIAGTPAYMAPEQTGRMNRSIDYRSDLYSLGVMLYELSTGVLPFTATDPMEWVHCQVARQPLPPSERAPRVPPQISSIVMKLLAKTAEDRYQTAAGVEADLRRCSSDWKSLGRIATFRLGEHDPSDRLLIPEKLYGRETESRALLDIFETVVTNGTSQFVVVSGYSGVGKSSLVNELQKAIVSPRGLFASGKFDRFKRGIPYDSFAQAFRTLVRQILVKPEQELSKWRDAMLEAVGPNGRLIIDLVPELAFVIGAQPAVQELPSQQAQYRLQSAFRRFLSVFAREEHPLVLFLDDLQWLDAASLQLLEHFITHPEMRLLLIIGAYRDNEVTPAHPLLLTLESIRRTGVRLHEMILTPLRADDVVRFVADALICGTKRADPLGRLVHGKTAGNPFFIIHFLTTLYEEGLLRFDPGESAWRWDLERIQAKNYTDNVVEFMIAKLRRLPYATRQALQTLACLGSGADVATLKRILGFSEERVHAVLWDAVVAGVLLRVGDAYVFMHDRIQEAAYSLIPESARAEMHLRIGRLLVSLRSGNEIEGNVFEIVNQFNRGINLLGDAREKDAVRGWNISAGRKAKTATAYVSARGYFSQALALQVPEAWTEKHEEAFALAFDLAECEYLSGRFEQAEELFRMLLEKAGGNPDRAKVYGLRAKLNQVAGKFDEAVSAALDGLRLFGLACPESEEGMQAEVGKELGNIQVNMRGRRIGDLLDAPTAADPEGQALMSLLVDAMPCAYLARPRIFPWLVLKAMNASLRDGNTQDSGFVYSFYAVLLVALFGDIPTAFEFSETALRLNEKFDNAKYRGTVLFMHGAVISFWRRHFSVSLAIMEKAFVASINVGDLLYAGYNGMLSIWYRIERGDALDGIMEMSKKNLAFAEQSRNETGRHMIRLYQQLMACLQGRTFGLISLEDETFSETELLDFLTQANFLSGTATYHLFKEMLAFTFECYDEALEQAGHVESMMQAIAAAATEVTHHFHHALTLTALYPRASAEQKKEFAATLEAKLRKLKSWADNCPENYFNRYALVAAEIARIEGRNFEAMDLYEKAVRSARDNGFLQNESLANELAGKFYLERGFDRIGNAYLAEARNGFRRWGAEGKAKHLERRFPRTAVSQAFVDSSSTIGATLEQLDLKVILKASQAAASEIIPDKLVEKLLTFAIENAGADRGLLVLSRDEGFTLEAEAATRGENVEVRLLHVTVTPEELPDSVFRYVLRTRETVVLEDATGSRLFSDDPYILKKRPKSILCLPLVKQSSLVGVLYLENNLTTRVFSPDRLGVLDILSSQAAISLENARLFEGLALENEKRRKAEEQLRQSQKMEAIGRLAGGIAHDFNNLLTAINGYSGLALHGMDETHPLHEFLIQILKSGERAAALTRQLLAYSRKQVMEPKVLDLNVIVGEMEPMLKRLIGEDVDLIAALSPKAILAKVDRGQVEQVLLNLVVNARDAMPQGGKLTLETGSVVLDAPYLGTHLEASVGPHAMLAVSDTGTGMTDEVKAKLFEPFFTTKEVGKGTGLGLSVVYGIVKQSGGSISVYSELGKGTTFRIYFPEVAAEGQGATELGATNPEANRGSETILLVEDEESVRKFARHALEAYGYTVVEAGDGLEALRILREDPSRFRLVITDVVMPEMGGLALAGRIAEVTPALPVLYISGFTENAAIHSKIVEAGGNFLQKPFGPFDLTRKVRRILDG